MSQIGKNGDNARCCRRQPSRCLRESGRTLLLLALILAGCEESRHTTTVEREFPPTLPPLSEDTPAKQSASPPEAFALYSTLAGKMARIEELLNGIDRLLDAPGFHERLVADAQELKQLLIESRGLYPPELPAKAQSGFDQAIDQTVAESAKLLESVQAEDREAAREAIGCLCRQRQDAHTNYSN